MVEENRTRCEEEDDERLRIAVDSRERAPVVETALREIMLGIFGCGKVDRRFCCSCCCGWCGVTLIVERGLTSCVE